MPLFSIITCNYNLSHLINEGLQLIFKQSFLDYEILVIDDGSTDNSVKICSELAKFYSNIKIITQNNQGLGGARNTGIRNAKGEYICFFDLDDKVNTNWLEKIFELIKDEKPDVLVYGYREINEKYNIITELKFQDKILKSQSEIRDNYVYLLSGLNFNNGFAWNKVYKREFLIKNNISFPDLRIQQDEVFNHNIYKHANSLITSSEVLYNYYVYSKGNTRNCFIHDRLNIFEKVKDSFFNLAEYWQLENSDLNLYIHSRFIRNCLYNRDSIYLKNSKAFRMQLFQNESLNESAVYLLENNKGLSTTEKLYLKSINNKTKFLFLLSEFISLFISIIKEIHNYLFKFILVKERHNSKIISSLKNVD